MIEVSIRVENQDKENTNKKLRKLNTDLVFRLHLLKWKNMKP